MKTFYQGLTPYYDEIFPVNDKQLSFLSSCFPATSTLLDVGAGTGNTAIAMAKAGYRMTAIEPEHSMFVKFSEKLDSNELPITILQQSMQGVSQLNEPFDGIYCIGNTLPHLSHLEEITHFLQTAYDKLNAQGMLVIQTVNYEKVLLQQGFSFPIIKKEAFTFTRQYELQNEKVMFTTILEDQSGTHFSILPLYPVTKTQLEAALQTCGFHSITPYGDYGKSPYTVESPGLVLTAVK